MEEKKIVLFIGIPMGILNKSLTTTQENLTEIKKCGLQTLTMF